MNEPNERNQLQQAIAISVESNDPILQKTAQEYIMSYRQNHYKCLIDAYLDIAHTHPLVSYRKFCSLQLRIFLFNPSVPDDPIKFTYLSLPDQEQVLIKIAETLCKEQDPQITKILVDLFQKASSCFFKSRHFQFIQLSPKLAKFFERFNLNKQILFSCFAKVLKSASYCFQNMKKDYLDHFFKLGFNNENKAIRLQTLQCFSSFFETFSSNKLHFFDNLIPYLFQAVNLLIQNDKCNQSFQILLKMIQSQFSYFRKFIKQQLKMFSNIFFNATSLTADDRYKMLTIFNKHIWSHPSQFNQDGESLKLIIEMIFFYMINISQDISKTWLSASQHYIIRKEKDQESKIIRVGMQSIDRMIFKIEQDSILKIIITACDQLLHQTDWRCRYSALMALSQLGEYVQIDEITSVLRKILHCSTDQNPKVRYAFYHALGQISFDLKPGLQKSFGSSLINYFLRTMLTDSVPIVVSHATSALFNFLQGVTYNQFADFYYLTMNILLDQAERCVWVIKVDSLEVIERLLNLSNHHFQPFAQRTLQILFDYFNEDTNPQSLKEDAIDLINLVIQSFEPDIFRPAAKALIELLINIQKKQTEAGINCIGIFISWKNIFRYFQSQLNDYQTNIRLIFDTNSQLTSAKAIIIRHLLINLIQNYDKTEKYSLLKTKTKILVTIMKNTDVCFMTQPDMNLFSELIINFLIQSDQQVNQSDSSSSSIEDQITVSCEDVKLQFVDVIEFIIKRQQYEVIPLANNLISRVLPAIFDKEPSQIEIKIGIRLINVIVESIDYQLLSSHWKYLSSILKRFMKSRSCDVRQVCSYGLGLFGVKTPTHLFDDYNMLFWLQGLRDSLDIPRKLNEKEISYIYCCQYEISAIGKILRHHSYRLDLESYLQFWISKLPLHYDIPEALIQHEILIQILTMQPQFLQSKDKRLSLERILNILGQIFEDKRLYNDAIKWNVKAYLSNLKNNPQYINIFESAWSSLKTLHKIKLAQIMK